ncbi:matrix-remodeling-associated protein 7-like [Haliotis cracherodii]|uniref:matrix-remodeling-associated protein 7-like n=1 Tax=Haliotis cracherodii TaxID=6455 RepID=UPI0039E9E212
MFDLSFIYDNATSISAVVLGFTIIALILSTKYTLSTIGRIWDAGDPRKLGADDKDSEQGDGEDCDGDDEAEDDDDQHKGEGDGLAGRDPVEYCEHIQGEVKRVKQRVTTKKIEEGLTADQLKEEQEIQRNQLQQIFKMMETQPDKFGVTSMDDVQHQMSLYG